MPFYEAGEHKVDHPPLFACREHKQLLRLRSSFIDEMLKSMEDIVPSNLHEIAAPYLGGDTNAFRLPDSLIPPRVLIYNPDFLKGPAALPYTLVFVDKRFIGIPAAYLTADRFDGCLECCSAPPAAAPARSASASSSGVRSPVAAPAKQSAVTGSGILRGANAAPAPAPARKPGSTPNLPTTAPTTAPGAARPNATPPPVRPKPAGPPPRPPQR